MSSKKRRYDKTNIESNFNCVIEGAGEVVEQKIDSTLEKNYMPYAMSVIMSRALPEIDGFKPSHRKLLYTMYKMGLLNSGRTKSANIVGQTMKLNPHGDSAIYDTMVRLSRGYEALLHPYVDSKGNFGKFYSRDMAWAAARYTEAKLDKICFELFRDIDKETVDFVDNYDSTLKEPTLLPVSYPSVLVNANTGIAVGMASSICSFNLREVCETTIELIKNPEHDISSTLLAPDFSGGGQLIYSIDSIKKIYETGRGSFRLRSRYFFDKSANCIDITQIPQTTTSEAIIEKVIDLVKQGRLKEVSDIRDETGIDGLKITIDLKRGADPDKLMLKLYKYTTLEDSFSCNFNVLINGVPRVLGVKDLLNEWIKFRVECIKRRLKFDLNKKSDKLHLLNGLGKIFLDIDKAIEIIRKTEDESEVVKRLMKGFSIDEIQANYVADIKLRYLNKGYILKRINEVSDLEKEISDINSILKDERKIKSIMIMELKEVIKNYGQPRKTILIGENDINNFEEELDISDYKVTLFLSEEGYFKKITPQSLRMNGEQKLKEGDKLKQIIETSNGCELLFFTDKCHVYKAKVNEFNDVKASVFGDYVPAKLSMEEDEKIICMVSTKDYSGDMLFFWENGKVSKVLLSLYNTKTNRRKLISAYNQNQTLVYTCSDDGKGEYLLKNNKEKFLLINALNIPYKTKRTTVGVNVFKLNKNEKLVKVLKYKEGILEHPEKYETEKIPSDGFKLNNKDKNIFNNFV